MSNAILVCCAARVGSTASTMLRVDLFFRGIYQWMREGREEYVELLEQRESELRSATIPRVEAAQGDLEGVDWSAAAVLGNWATLRGETTEREVHARMAHDGEYLYLELQEAGIDPEELVLGDAVTVWNEDELLAIILPPLSAQMHYILT
jgi:hypothetical protein